MDSDGAAQAARGLNARMPFARALGFALFAALGAMPARLVLGALLGGERSLAWYVLGLVPCALLLLGPSLRAGVLAALLGCGLGLLGVLSDASVETAALVAVLALGLGRSALSHPRPLLRALWFELSISVVAWLLLVGLHDGSLLGDALCVWSFWLVQSAYALLPAQRPAHAHVADGFELASQAAERILQGR